MLSRCECPLWVVNRQDCIRPKADVENVLRLMEHFEGEEVYINKLHEAFRGFWQSRMKEEHRVRKFTLPQLAHRYGVSEKRVRRIVDDPRQISMYKSEPSS